MKLYSTNHQSPTVSLREAVMNGLAPDGGLYMPEELKRLPEEFFKKLESLSFQEIAFEVAWSLMKEEMAEKDLKTIVDEAISFDAPLVPLSDTLSVLELFHGPTLAFKDFGARFMARLMAHFLKDSKKELTILVATSGDTGSAVASGFFGIPGVRVILLYPSGKVSEIQEKQLTTMGGNVTALEVKGVFDDCQRMVKEAFLDKELKSKLSLSSANSINIGRLIPQSFYYFYAYAQARLRTTRELIFSVPSGNFGNLTAGLIAKRMGLPVTRFIAACNANDVVPQYLKTGRFEPKPSKKTMSNAMDVGNPSNFARMRELYDSSKTMRQDIWSRSFSDAETEAAMKEVQEKYHYILEPHGAVGYLGAQAFLKENPSDVSAIILETAHPAKFLNVPLPVELQVCRNRPKKSVLISSEFRDLKNFLLKN